MPIANGMAQKKTYGLPLGNSVSRLFIIEPKRGFKLTLALA